MTQQKQVVAINVTGAPGSGKSAVVNRIAQVLEAEGFEIQIAGQVTMRSPEILNSTIRTLVQSTKVQITESKPRRATDDGKA